MQPEDGGDGVEILIVEDSPTQALKLQHLLTRHGYRVEIARSGREALAALEGGTPSLILSDIGLPEMDGYELCRRIKAREGRPNVPVILLTSFLDPQGAIRALQCGADNLLARVFEEQALLSHLKDILANLELRRQAPGQPGLEVAAGGETHSLPPECGGRALDLFLSAYRIAVQRSAELRQAREALERQAQEQEPVRAAAPPTEVPVPAAPVATPARGLHILLAEDSDVNQRLAARTLEKHGHSVVVAGNGRLALAALEAARFDLILMDMEMPEMGGLEAAAAVRAREQGTHTHIPIIAMTAHDSPEDRERCLAVGMDGYTTKPLQINALLAVMERLAPAPPVPEKETPVPMEGGTDGRSAAVFDREAALAHVEGDVELLEEIIALFLEESPKLLAELQDAVARLDGKALERAAHSLKGSSASLGADGVVEAAARLEAMGREGEIAQAPAAQAALENALAALTSALADGRANPGPQDAP